MAVVRQSSALTTSTGSLRARRTSRSAYSVPSGRVALPRPLLATVAPRRRAAIDVLVSRAGSSRSNIVNVDAEALEAEIMGRDRPLIVDFYATWCGPCLLLAKELEKARQGHCQALTAALVAEQLGDGVRILKLDTDRHPDISTQLQIQGLPTLIFVGTDPNKPALRTEGLLPADVIVDIVTNDLQARKC